MWSNGNFMVGTTVSYLFTRISYFYSSICSSLVLPSTTTYYKKKVDILFFFNITKIFFQNFHFRLDQEPKILSNAPQKTSDFEYIEVDNLNRLSNDNVSTYPK